MKLLPLATALSTAVLSFVPSFHAAVNAQEADYACFMTTKSGQVIDLSESICGVKKSTESGSPNSDQAFMAAYKHDVMKYSVVRDTLLASVQETPEQSIEQAKSLCSDLKAGLSYEEIENSQVVSNAETEDAESVNAAIINSLATKYYCPEMSQR